MRITQNRKSGLFGQDVHYASYLDGKGRLRLQFFEMKPTEQETEDRAGDGGWGESLLG